jgi:transcriptional regulator with XRE-family HTH domain
MGKGIVKSVKYRQLVAARLRATREAVGLRVTEFGHQAWLEHPQYSQYESGKRLPDIAAAIMLCRAYNLTLDWIYIGDLGTLPHKLAQAIQVKHGNTLYGAP